jgi:putative resolvase
LGNFVFSSSPSRLVSVGQAAELLGVCINTVRRMCSRGELQFTTTFGKHRRIHLSEIRRWQGFDEVDDSIRKTLIYARVSGRRQKVEGNLSRQVDRLKVYCESLGEAKENLICISEQGSGLSETRTGYLKLLDLVIEGRIGRIVVEHRDRLARYGVVVLETLCEKFGVEILITHQKQDISEDEEMTLDILNLITVFSARRHGRRNGLTTTMPINDELRERIIQLHEQGQGMTRIARKIREEGFHCEKTNKPHAINSVRKTLKAYEKLKKATSTLLPNTKNSLKKFIKEMCSSSKESKVFTRPLFKAYAAWCLKNQIEAGSSRRMTEQLMRDYETGANCYRYMFVKGLALKGNPLASEGPEG